MTDVVEQLIHKPEDYTGPSHFVHLHNHTVYSTLDGVATPEQYADECAKRGYPAMSATEHGHMASVPDMYLAFRKHNLKYIAGCEVYFNDWEIQRQQTPKVRALRDSDPELYMRMTRNRHLTLLAKNYTGYVNLLKLTTQAYATGLYGVGRNKYPRVWFDQLCKFKEGLIVLSGCLNGPVCHELRQAQVIRTVRNKVDKTVTFTNEVIRDRPLKERLEAAVKYVRQFKRVFGDDYYIELQMPGIADDDIVFRHLIQIADHLKLKIVLANDCHYLNRKDFMLQKIMMAVEQGMTVDDPNLFHVNSDEQFMKTRAELWTTFANGPYSRGLDNRLFEEMCDNSLAIADKCEQLEIDVSPKTPELPDADAQLRRIVATRLRELGYDKNPKRFLIDGNEVTYVEQAKLELNRFIDKGFASYFHITRDLVQFGKSKGWPFSPRGSAGGSLVCFLLGIHVLDPMLWGLSFDRFLSPSRGGYILNVKMPSE